MKSIVTTRLRKINRLLLFVYAKQIDLRTVTKSRYGDNKELIGTLKASRWQPITGLTNLAETIKR